MSLQKRLKRLAKAEAIIRPYADCVRVQVRVYPAQDDFESHDAWFATCRVAARTPIEDTTPEPSTVCRDFYRFDAAQNTWAFTERVPK